MEISKKSKITTIALVLMLTMSALLIAFLPVVNAYDYETHTLILYRSHTGMLSEDKMFEDVREESEINLVFVPICDGMTFFKIQVPKAVKVKIDLYKKIYDRKVYQNHLN